MPQKSKTKLTSPERSTKGEVIIYK